MVAKAGLGIIGLGAISIGGVALAKPYWLGMADPMPSFHFLSEDQNSSSSDYNNKFGGKYKNYLVGVANKENAQSGENKTNKDWWEWAYRKLSRDEENSKSTKFKKGGQIEGGFITTESNADKSLHKVCKDAYEKGESELDGSEGKFKKDDVWKYCSPGLLTHASNDSYGQQKIGGKDGNKSILVSVEDKSNDWFWEQRDKDFWTNSGTWSGNGATGSDSSTKSIFKAEYDTNNSKSHGSRKTIKELCKQAYNENHGSSTNNNETDAKKFCVLETTATQ